MSTPTEQHAFRVDVCGHQYSLATKQPSSTTLNQQLTQLMYPYDPQLSQLATTTAQQITDAIEQLMEGGGSRRRSTRRCSTAFANNLRNKGHMTANERRRLAASLSELCDPVLTPTAPLTALDDMLRLVGAELGDRVKHYRAFEIQQQKDGEEVLEFVMKSQSAQLLGLYTTSWEDIERPFGTGLIEHLVSLMNGFGRRHPNIRHCWTLLLSPGIARWCLVEADAIHLSRTYELSKRAGRHKLMRFLASVSMAEDWRMGVDPTMRWRNELGRWEIQCPVDDIETQTVYAAGQPLFVADTYFGRFTRCFYAALKPDGPFEFVLKDSWQLADPKSDDEMVDEIGVLRHIKRRMEAAGSKSLYPKLECGGTVLVNVGSEKTVQDTSRLILDKADLYTRWTVPHGCSSESQLHRRHRRMVTGPVGQPLQTLRNEQEVITVLADAMRSHSEILRHAGTLHRDISLNNVMAVRMKNSQLRGMLIDFDHAVLPGDSRNQQQPGSVGTGPFMSIANLESLDVARTAADDWESLLCLLFCLSARDIAAMDEMGQKFSCLNNGTAEFKREMFGSTRALDAAIAMYLAPSHGLIIRLIRSLYHALFEHPRCQGTAQLVLRGNRHVDPVLRRVQYANDLQTRCLSAITAIAREVNSMSSLSEHMALISHRTPNNRGRPPPVIVSLPPQPPASVYRGRSAIPESNSSLSTLKPRSSIDENDLLSAYHLHGTVGLPTTTTTTTTASSATTLADPSLIRAQEAAALLYQQRMCYSNKRKAQAERNQHGILEPLDSPRTKRRKMAHAESSESFRYSPELPSLPPPLPKSQTQIQSKAKRNLFVQ